MAELYGLGSGPTVSITQPSTNLTVTKGDKVSVGWDGTSTNGSASVSIGYDKDSTPDNGNSAWILTGQSVDGSLPWDTSPVATGSYRVFAKIIAGASSAYGYGPTVTVLACDIVLRVQNPGDGTSLKLAWTGSGGSACKVTRKSPDGTSAALTDRTLGTNFQDTSVSRGETYEYQVERLGSAQRSNVATGKAEQVVILVRGINLLGVNDHAEYWSGLTNALGDAYTYWDACHDSDSSMASFLITGTESWEDEAAKLKQYIDAKRSAYVGCGYPAPERVDMIAHSMGGLIARMWLADEAVGMVPNAVSYVRNLITLSGTHCGSPLATDAIGGWLGGTVIVELYGGPVVQGAWDGFTSQLALPAIWSLRPAFVLGSGLPAAVRGTSVYMAGGDAGKPFSSWVWAFGHGWLWYVKGYERNDGAVPLWSTYGQQAEWKWSAGSWPHAELVTYFNGMERSPYALDHGRIHGVETAGNLEWSRLSGWVSGILDGGSQAGQAVGMVASLSLRQPARLDDETAVTNSDSMVVVTNAFVQAASTNAHPFLVDASEHLTTWMSSTNSMVVALRRPDGSVIGPHTGDTDTNVTYTSYDADSKVLYQVLSPGTGVWYVLVTPSNDVPSVSYHLQATVFNAVGLQFFCSPSWTVTGDTVIVGCTFGAATQEVQSAAIAARVYLETNEVFAATLYDDGQHYDAGTNDGLFACAWSNVPLTGVVNVRYDVAGVRTNGNPFTRVGFSDLAVSPVKALFTGAFASWGSDTNADGALDTLSADIGVEIQTDGVYTISGTLLAGDGTELDSALCPTQALTAGTTANLALVFSGTRIEAAGKDGPYTLGPVYALDVAECYERVGVSGTYTTAVYLAASFAAKDSDGDRVSDAVEATLGTNPDLADTDGDGSADYEELSRDAVPTNYTAGVDSDPNNTDTDGDTLWDGEEAIVGTSPVSKDDFFAVSEVQVGTNAAVVVSWDTQTGRTYTVYASTNLPSTNQVSEWSSVYQTSGDGGRQSYTNADATLTNRFFRVGVQRP